MPENKFILGDCMDQETGLPSYPDKFFDLAIVDPPYGIGNFVQTSGNVRGEGVVWNDETPVWDYFIQLRRVSRNQIIWGANYYNCFDSTGGAIVWVKNQPMPNFSKAEIASCSFHKKVEVANLTWTNYVNTKQSKHPCEKPIALYKWLLQTYAQPGDLVLDTHVGSASSLIACEALGFNYHAWEIDPDYYHAAKNRMSKGIQKILL